MGSSESTLINSQNSEEDGITTVSERIKDVDPVLQKLSSLTIASPILTTSASTTESSLTDILVRKPSTSSNTTGIVDPKVLLELFTVYQELQEKQAQNINKRQEEIENKIEVADALALKLLQRYNYSVSAMKTTATHLSGVDELQVELGVLKGRLTEVVSNCDALCKRIAADGPEPLCSSVKPFAAAAAADLRTTTSHPSALDGAPLQLKPEP
ncbi:hypothetical protein HanXRQr2_Chr16g0776391 [Helianthus annuus]|uniref:Uncharacterized protein n=1 Tax=Helianthus annuus TaxID=4232 RepID=A0A9K3DY25_HELAN|nr:uncharacterized protein LOC110915400 isoform X2 [Helianthus annuus]KAF5762411.1 hypothetical protein HanXRQr2_Chr16g0776391 [Helianthus annuus]KAJ0440143.1 hypothetical protein HanHA300_Chr16g0633171 [Helianthus annuus]KAJ0642925.1 hypothetical protein HanLR1_Chr16g0643761 [Helianthus annuus]KAJ0646789.1 hypothetical protein HanOQP8_Chr16g0639051 [Helianthus annuus]